MTNTAALIPAQSGHDDSPAPQNLFGICHRVGEDFGFNPLWLRLAFASALILNPVAVITGYFVLGAIVLSSRMLFPNRQTVAAPAPVAVLTPRGPVTADRAELPLAA